MKTSWSRTEVSYPAVSKREHRGNSVENSILISTEVSPLANFFSSTIEGFWPRRSQMASTSCGCEDPEKMHVERIGSVSGEDGSVDYGVVE